MKKVTDDVKKEAGSVSITSAKSNASQGPTVVSVMPKELCQEMGQSFDAFIRMNAGAVPGKIARKFDYNMKSIRLNAEAYGKKEVEMVKTNVEHVDGRAVFWNGEHEEDTYEMSEGTDDAPAGPVLIGGLVTQRETKETPFWGFFNEKGEQLSTKPEILSKMKFYVKDTEKREVFTAELKALTTTPVEVSLHLFSKDELDELKLPVSDGESIDKFYSNFSHE